LSHNAAQIHCDYNFVAAVVIIVFFSIALYFFCLTCPSGKKVKNSSLGPKSDEDLFSPYNISTEE